MNKVAAKSSKKTPKKKVDLRSEIVYLCSCCAVITLLVLAGFNIDSYIQKDKVLGATTISGEETYKSLIEEKNYWQDFLNSNPEYLDGWVAMIEINLNLNDKLSAKEAYIKAREIDPNSLKIGPYIQIFGD